MKELTNTGIVEIYNHHETMGGFQCVPELYRTYATWKLSQPEDRDHFKPDVSGFEIVKGKNECRRFTDLQQYPTAWHQAEYK